MKRLSYKKAGLFLKSGLLFIILSLFSSPSYAWQSCSSKYDDRVADAYLGKINYSLLYEFFMPPGSVRQKEDGKKSDRECAIKLINEGSYSDLSPEKKEEKEEDLNEAFKHAVKLQDIEMIDLLIKVMRDNGMGFYFHKRLTNAIALQNIDIVERLLALNIDVNSEFRGIWGADKKHFILNHLMHAVKLGGYKIVEALIEDGADVNFQSLGGTRVYLVYHYLAPSEYRYLPGVIVSAREVRKNIETHGSIRSKENVKKTDISVEHYSSTSALRIAIRKEWVHGVKLLLEAGADKTINTFKKLPEKNTDLMVAVSTGNIEIVDLLLKAGANPNLKDFEGDTALDYARIYKVPEIADLIRSYM